MLQVSKIYCNFIPPKSPLLPEYRIKDTVVFEVSGIDLVDQLRLKTSRNIGLGCIYV